MVTARCGKTVAAIKPLPGYHWTTNGEWAWKEIIVPGKNSAFIVEVFDDNKKDINELAGMLGDKPIIYEYKSAKRICYTSITNECMELDFYGDSKINGEKPDFSEYPLFGSKYVFSQWGSGKVTVNMEGRSLTLGMSFKI